MTKFVAAVEMVNPDVDVLAMEIRDGSYPLQTVMDEALDHNETIHIVDEDMELAQTVVTGLNEMYANEVSLVEAAAASMKENQSENNSKEETKMTKSAKEIVNEVFEANKEEEVVSNAEKIAKSSAAQKFLAKHGSALKNSQKAPAKKEEGKKETKTETTKEEKKMNTSKTMGSAKKEETKEGRRRLSAGANENKTNTQKEEKKMNKTTEGGRRRLSAGATSSNTQTMGNRKRRLATGASAMNGQSTFQRFEGPWYLNAELYPVINRLQEIIDNDMKDAELGVTDVRLVDPADVYTRDNHGVLVVVEILFGGVVLRFAVKENKNEESASDLSSNNIIWKTASNGKLFPAYGFWRNNAPTIRVECKCGNKFEAPATNAYCRKCQTRHEVEISADAKVKFELNDWVGQDVPSIRIPRDVLALAMAVAQYGEGLPMYGVIAEDAE